MAQIICRDLAIGYEGKTVVQNINLSVKKGDYLCVIGENGAGKTTLVKLLCGLYPVSSGKITIQGTEVSRGQADFIRDQVAVLFQDALVLPYTVAENVSLKPLEETDQNQVWAALEQAGLSERIKQEPNGILTQMTKAVSGDGISLSGGEAQKLLMARMLYHKSAQIWILDEPTAGQDAESLERCAALIREMRKEKTVLIITHDPELIAGACDRCIGLSDGHAEIEFSVHSERDLQAVRQYMERFHLSNAPAKKQHKERFHPATKLLYWLALLVVISTSNNHLVYAVYTALILLTAADGWLGTALAGGMSFGLLWASNALLPGTVFSFMLVLFPRIIAIGISMRTLIGRNEASRTLAALRNLHLPERFIMIVAVIFRFFPVLSGDMKLLRQSIRTRGVFTSPLQKLRALSSYIEILTVPMALRVIRIAETLSASAETRGIDLTRRKSNYLSLRFSAWDAVFCVLLAASIAAGLIL